MMHQQQITLGVMFKYVKSGGVFVIEDLHTSVIDVYTRPGDTGTLQMLQHYNDTNTSVSNIMTSDEIDYLHNNIDAIHIEQGNVSPIAFIIKK